MNTNMFALRNVFKKVTFLRYLVFLVRIPLVLFIGD
jgi:hypothetical protein